MKIRQILIPIGILSVAVSLFPKTASAFTITHLSSDAEMNALLTDMTFVAEGRIGDRRGAATHELNLHEEHPGNPSVTAQFNWINGTPQPFELTYNADSSLVSFMVGSQTLSHTYTDPFSDIFIRTQAVNKDSSIVLDHLFIDGDPISESSTAIGNEDGLDILRLSNLPGSFKLTGQSTMNWEDIPPTQSRLAYQIKVARTEPEPEKKEIPEPNSLASLLLLGMTGVYLSRQHKQ